MKLFLRIVGLPVFFLSIQGCITPAVCTPEGAREAGRQRALDGLSMDPQAVSICEADPKIDVMAHYKEGFATGLKTLCSRDFAMEKGRSAGSEGALHAGLPSLFQACSQERPQLEQAYKLGYQQGLATYCNETKVRAEGLRHGQTGEAFQFDAQAYSACDTQTQRKLELSYKRAYQESLEQFCAAPNLESESRQAGREHQDQPAIETDFNRCAPSVRDRLTQRSQRAYLEGLKEYCEVTRHLDMIKRYAREQVEPSYDQARYSKCVQLLPDVYAEYRARFQQERQQLARELCTYAQGRQQGLEDATRFETMPNTRPTYCDASSAQVYWQAYQQAWNEQKAQLCDRGAALEKGYQDGLQGWRVQYEAPRVCPAALRRNMEDSYFLGHRRGTDLYLAKQQPGNPRPPSGPQSSPPQDSDEVRIIEVCGQTFQFPSDKQTCIEKAQKVKGRGSLLVPACKAAFNMSSDVLSCIAESAGRNYNPDDAVRACTKAFSFSSDRFKCLKVVAPTLFNPHRAISACDQAFTSSSDKMECLAVVAKAVRDPSEKIAACVRTFTYSSDRLRCVGP